MKKSLNYCLLMFLASVYFSGTVNADQGCVKATLNYAYSGDKEKTTGDPQKIAAWVQLRINPNCGLFGYIHDQGSHIIMVPKEGFTIMEGHANGGSVDDTKQLLKVEANQIKDGMMITCGANGVNSCVIQ